MGHHNHSITLTSLRDIDGLERQSSFEEVSPAQTVYGVFAASAARYGDRCALNMVLSGEESELTRRVGYRALLEGITRSANLFASLGGENAGVAYLLPSLIETHFVLWGAETSGFAVPLNPLLTPEQIVELVRAAGAKLLVTVGPALDAQIWGKSVHVKRALPNLSVVCIEPPAQPEVNCVSFHEAVAQRGGDRLEFSASNSPDSIVAYFHTGGTTGGPKLVAHTSRNQVCAAFGAAALMGLRETDRVTNGMPMFHVGGAIAGSLSFFMRGAEIVVLSPQGLRNPDIVRRFWNIVDRFGITVLVAVPTALTAILAIPVTGSLATVRFGLTGAAPIPRSVVERFTALTGKPLHEILGMTESGGVTAVDPTGDQPTAGSVGIRLPYTTLRVRRRNQDGRLGDDCVAGEVGVLFVTGPTVSPGYLDSTQNDKVFADGGLDTGDLAYLSADGKLFIAGRAKDIIIRSGHNIDPAMVEAAFARCPSVATAVVVGQPDPYAGELPIAYVTLSAGMEATEAELIEFACQYIAERPAWPKRVHIVDALPMTAVGKVHKPALRADATVRLLRSTLAALARDPSLEIEARVGGKRGLEVVVTMSGADDAAVEKVDAEMKKFLFEYSIRRTNTSLQTPS
ncbi:hypothetical protein AYM40_32805 [Paraburkholderia phytofirmans OLGA172]|uniref:Acyl-CoA synthetase n=1 Tax=Paraburkholderia phytofirmans OLGA172 TaxID=1417228 RepID=A0A160FUI7_9BURK|nr:AMP-binding protein [Paraburkholderia phytofirmans]ANB76925.1 hypothetical protein AYM40_32805 [Paraburkholderia phytofirmans OLGA172]